MEVLEYTKMYDVYDVYGKYFVNGGEQKKKKSIPQNEALFLTFDPVVCVNFPARACSCQFKTMCKTVVNHLGY